MRLWKSKTQRQAEKQTRHEEELAEFSDAVTHSILKAGSVISKLHHEVSVNHHYDRPTQISAAVYNFEGARWQLPGYQLNPESKTDQPGNFTVFPLSFITGKDEDAKVQIRLEWIVSWR